MYKLQFSQTLPITLQEAWDFFSSPTNLSKITPEALNLKIKSIHTLDKIYPGQIITYTVRPIWNLPIEWVTEIVAVDPLNYFIDEQRFGPYTFWHHEHRFTSMPGGILMEDIIHYKLPFGILGKALNYLKIEKDLNQIFFYRCEVLEKLFKPRHAP